MTRWRRSIDRLWDKFARYPARELNDLHAARALAPLSERYAPWSPIAMRPAAVVTILNEIVTNDRNRIVECGGGISTLYIARLLRQRARGHLWTVEDDGPWADYLRAQVESEGASAYVSVLHADLAPTSLSIAGANGRWYDERKVREWIGEEPIELLIVDGPAGYTPERRHARYPAVPYLRPLLADDYAVVLDDIHRPGEQEIVERWERELGIAFERRYSAGRIAIAHSRPSFAV
jgi:hypothetical protein